MEFESSVTPRRLIRHIVENKLVSTHPRYRLRKRVASPDDWDLQKDGEVDRPTPTPRTLVKNVLKEKEANDSSVYIPRAERYRRVLLDKEITPFKRRAIERKRSLRSSKIDAPRETEKDIVTSAPKHLEIPSPRPYLFRSFRRGHMTVEDFEHGVREIRRKRELATAASKGNRQVKPDSAQSGSETEAWDPEGRGALRDGNVVDVRSGVESTEESEAKNEGKPSCLKDIPYSSTGSETEAWDEEGRPIEFAETAGENDLRDTEEIQEEITPIMSSEDESLHKVVVIEPDVDRESTLTSKRKPVEGHLPPGTPKPKEMEDIVPTLHSQYEHLAAKLTPVKSSERVSSSESEMPEVEESYFHALEVLEDDNEEEIPPIQFKSVDVPKRTTKKFHPPRLPFSLTKKLFQHFSGMKVSRDALDAVESCSDAYFEQLTEDLLAYSSHAGRKTITPEDVELLLRRQNIITKEKSLHTLVEEYLPLEYRQEIIPMAVAHNVIIPK